MTWICLVVIVMEGDLPEYDLLTVGRDARGLISAFATLRTFRAYSQPELVLVLAYAAAKLLVLVNR